MSAPIAGFIGAVILSVAVVIWIAYCMFCRERHKSDHLHYDITDLRCENYEIAQQEETKEKKSDLSAGIFILPSRRHRHKNESYEKRPDYPENPASSFQQTEQLVEIFNDNVDADVHRRDDGIVFEMDSGGGAQYESDV